MKKNKLILNSFLHALSILVYIALVASVMQNADKLFGQVSGIIGVMVALMLLVLSVAVMGILIFGRPIMLYMDNKKKEAVSLLLYIISWLLLLVILVFGIIFAWNS